MAVGRAGFELVALDDEPVRALSVRELLLGAIARADCVVADISEPNVNVLFELGLALAMVKGIFLLNRKDSVEDAPEALEGALVLAYDPSRAGLASLAEQLTQSLLEYRRFPRSPQAAGRRLPTPFFVDWEALDLSEAENLCRELLAQMGYQRLDWEKESREFDLVAELPKKDPDGFEYREVWLVSMGRSAPPEMLLEMASHEPDYFLHRLFRDERFGRLVSRAGADVPVTLLIILLRSDQPSEQFERMRARLSRRIKGEPVHPSLRVRVWDRNYLTSLVQQFPQIGYKYFSDGGRSRSKSRKTYEELYREYAEMANRQAALIEALEDERNKRVRAERDAIWKDISFTAAHKIGNPIFAIETNLDPLEKRVAEQRTSEAIEVVESIRVSVENAKGIVDQFKSLTRAQNISPLSMLLRPVLQNACRAPRNQGVLCEIDCPADLAVEGDADRLMECFDELSTNAMHWMNKPDKRIQILVAQPDLPAPASLDTSKAYALIHFKDNGPGVPLECKERIFDAFFTTRDHGTGLGLAVVRRIIEGHGGLILENGRPGDGADFEIYLPLPKKLENAPGAQLPRGRKMDDKGKGSKK